MSSRTLWLHNLAKEDSDVSAFISSLNLPEIIFRDTARSKIIFVDAFNFCGDLSHNKVFARILRAFIHKGLPHSEIRKYIVDLTSGRQTGGAVCELLVYDWLNEHGAEFETQVQVTGRDILNPNGSELDGKLTHSSEVFFDIKTYGFVEIMVSRLTKRLEEFLAKHSLANYWVAVEGSWDISAEELQTLLDFAESETLGKELAENTVASRGSLRFVRREKSSVQISARSVNPYADAEEHGSYVFRFAKQFARSKPFVLFLAYHPWLGGLSLSTDFASYNSIYMRSLARRTFMQHLRDTSLILGEPKSEVSRMLSAIGFLDISHVPHDTADLRRQRAELKLFRNPNALHKLPDLAIDPIKWDFPHAIEEDSFSHDNY